MSSDYPQNRRKEDGRETSKDENKPMVETSARGKGEGKKRKKTLLGS